MTASLLPLLPPWWSALRNPVLFLDIDGVLNSAHYFESRACAGVTRMEHLQDLLDPDAVARLDRIVTATDCKIVLATSWTTEFSRLTVTHVLHRAGLSRPEAVWLHILTADLDLSDPLCCAHEINNLLSILPPRPFVILDDEAATAHFQPAALVQTAYATGLTDVEAKQCIERLTLPPNL